MNEHRVVIPEHLAQIESNFLTELWGNPEAQLRERKTQLLAYYVQRGLETLTALPVSNTIAMITFAVSLFLFAGFLLVLRNVETVLLEAGSNRFITAYLKDGVSDAQLNALLESLKDDSRVERAEDTSKGQALKFFEKELSERQSFLEGLREKNPLPASIDVFLKRGERSGAEALIEDLRHGGLVDDVVFGSDWFERVESVVRVVRFFGLLFGIIVLVVVVFLIGNTIKLVMYSRRDEIEIMQLVGAPDRLITVPFVIGGMLQGFLGAVAGIVLLRIAFSILRTYLRGATVLGVSLPELSFLSGSAIWLIICGGAVVGAAASLLALSRHMNA